MKSKVKGIIVLICIMLLFFVVVLFRFGKNKSDIIDKIEDTIKITEAVDSINLLYDVENYINVSSFGENKNDEIDSDAVSNLLKTLKISDDYADKVKKIAPEGKMNRNQWGNILLILGQATGISKVCNEGTISVFNLNKEENQVISDKGNYKYKIQDGLEMSDKTITCIYRENVIIFIMKIENDVEFQNVLIKKTEGDLINVCINDCERSFRINGLADNDNEIQENVMADILIKNGNVQELRLKRDKLSAKILSVSDEVIELEGFGRITVADTFRVFQDEIFTTGSLTDIVVGNNNVSFIVADKEICGAILQGAIQSTNIRVLLNSSGYSDMFHNIVSITSQVDFNVIFNEKSDNTDSLTSGNEIIHKYNAGDTLVLDANNEILKYSRIKIVPTDGNSRLKVSSISRNSKNPEYRGNLEISLYEGRLILINEVSVEEYLYSVVPSEMPSSYGVEALKVQAVCARSYAISHMSGSRLAQYGAHVDDSTAYQVYNNTSETENSISAVDATKGMVMNYNNEVINAYFYATSCGSTTTGNVWSDTQVPYIEARYLNSEKGMPDLMNNDVFTEFIKQKPETYDMDSVWYRWNLSLSIDTISNSINNIIYSLYCGNNKQVLTQNSLGEFESKPIYSVGKVIDISVTKREVGGIIDEMIITGDKAKVKVLKQGNIRKLFNPYGNDIVRNDGSVINTFSSLPSAFFSISKGVDGNYYEIYGGGYGHGAGMSQTAVKKMVEKEMNYKDILKFFYPNIEVELTDSYIN